MSKLDNIIKKFLCCAKLNEINWKDELEGISWEGQKTLIEETIHNPIVLKFPISYSYQIAFVKCIVKYLEDNNFEIHDDVYNGFCILMKNNNLSSDYFFKHYKVTNVFSGIVSLKESSNLISDGTTGLHSWEGNLESATDDGVADKSNIVSLSTWSLYCNDRHASKLCTRNLARGICPLQMASLALSEWCMQNKGKLNGKYILELGSGVGLAGILVGKFCSPKKICLTDCHPKVLELLQENVKLNFNYNEIYENNSIIEVFNLPWENISDETISKKITQLDFVIAADVIYDPTLFPVLLDAFSYCFEINKKCNIILASTIRNENTLNNFISMRHNYNFEMEEIEKPLDFKNSDLYWSPKVKINFFHFYKLEK